MSKMVSLKNLLLLLLVGSSSKSVLSDEKCASTNDIFPNTGFGFELMQQRMDNLQISFMELFDHVKQLGEIVINNQHTIEKNLMETNNLIKMQDCQTTCANHVETEKELQSSKPNANIPVAELAENHAVKSCQDVNSNSTGRFEISGIDGEIPFAVLCQMERFGGGWLVFQHRFNGSVDFYRNWTEYRNGFGDAAGEFWLGLEKISQLTKEGTWELLVEMTDFQNNYKYARYSEFAVGSESEKYALVKLGSYSGTAGDYLKYHKGIKFSTFDQNNDNGNHNCAVMNHGAWWYNNCYHSNLNGLYANIQQSKAIRWQNSLKSTWMMIRRI